MKGVASNAEDLAAASEELLATSAETSTSVARPGHARRGERRHDRGGRRHDRADVEGHRAGSRRRAERRRAATRQVTELVVASSRGAEQGRDGRRTRWPSSSRRRSTAIEQMARSVKVGSDHARALDETAASARLDGERDRRVGRGGRRHRGEERRTWSTPTPRRSSSSARSAQSVSQSGEQITQLASTSASAVGPARRSRPGGSSSWSRTRAAPPSASCSRRARAAPRSAARSRASPTSARR